MNKNENKLKINFTGSRFVPDDTAKGLFMFLVFQTVVSLIYQLLYMMGFVQEVWQYIFTLVLDVCFVGCVYFVAVPKNINMSANLRMKKAPNFKQIVICIVISLICLFGFSALTNLFLEVLYRVGYHSISTEIVIPDLASYLFYVVIICVAPAICEEILFRGLICNGLKKIGNVTAVLGSAFLFMIMHGSPDQTVHQFILGVILALAFLVTNNLWVPIIIHFVNNFTAVTISFLLYGDSSSTTTESASIYLNDYLIYAVISAVVAGIIIYFLLKALSKNDKKTVNVEPVEKRMGTPIISDIGDYSIDFNREYSVVKEVSGEEFANENIVKVDNPYENKLSGMGKVMYVISVIWLAVDWISALALGFSLVG